MPADSPYSLVGGGGVLALALTLCFWMCLEGGEGCLAGSHNPLRLQNYLRDASENITFRGFATHAPTMMVPELSFYKNWWIYIYIQVRRKEQTNDSPECDNGHQWDLHVRELWSLSAPYCSQVEFEHTGHEENTFQTKKWSGI